MTKQAETGTYKKVAKPNKHIVRHNIDGEDIEVNGKEFPRGFIKDANGHILNPQYQVVRVKLNEDEPNIIKITPDPGEAHMSSLGFERVGSSNAHKSKPKTTKKTEDKPKHNKDNEESSTDTYRHIPPPSHNNERQG